MKRPRFPFFLAAVFFCSLLLGAGAHAAPVGRLIRVEGRVDVLKGGKLPAVAARVQDELQPGDIVRTKSGSRAQIQFVDETTLTIAPESRVAVEEYLFDPKAKKRRAILQVFMGMVKTVVHRLYRLDEPDFILKSHTAVMGVRGTEWIAQLLPNATDIYAIKTTVIFNPVLDGSLEVKNIFPEVIGVQNLKSMEFTRVGFNQTPTVKVKITEQDLQAIQNSFMFRGEADKGIGKDEAAYAGLADAGPSGGEPSLTHLRFQIPEPSAATLIFTPPRTIPQAPAAQPRGP